MLATKRKAPRRSCNDPKQKRFYGNEKQLTLSSDNETPYMNIMYNRNHSFNKEERFVIWIENVGRKRNTKCPSCLKSIDIDNYEVAHLHAKSLGGPKMPWNYIISCVECNKDANTEHFLVYMYEKNPLNEIFDEIIYKIYEMARDWYQNEFKHYIDSIYYIILLWHGSTSNNDGKIPLKHPLWDRIRHLDIERINNKNERTRQDIKILNFLK